VPSGFRGGRLAENLMIDSVDDPIGTSDWTLKGLIGSVLTN